MKIELTPVMTGAAYQVLAQSNTVSRAAMRLTKRAMETLKTQCMTLHADGINGDWKAGTWEIDQDTFDHFNDLFDERVEKLGFPGHLAEGYAALDEILTKATKQEAKK